MNWKLFWIRLTIVISIIVYIIMVLYFLIDDPWSVYYYAGKNGILLTLLGTVSYLLFSILFPATVWVMYFAIRWIYNGLKK